MNQYLNEIYKQTADEGYFDYARCERPDGTFYGTGGRCVLGTKVGARVDESSGRKGGGGGVSKEDGDNIAAIAKKGLAAGLTKADIMKIQDDVRAETGRKQIKQGDLDIFLKYTNARLGGGEEKTASPTPKPKAEAAPKPKAEPKAKPAAKTPEQKAEEKYLAKEEKVNKIAARMEELKRQVEAKGEKTYFNTPGFNAVNKQLKEEFGVSIAQLTSMQVKLREEIPERLKEERKQERIRKAKAELAAATPAQRKKLIEEYLAKKQNKYDMTDERDIKYVKQNLDDMKKFMKSSEELNTLQNQVAYQGMRLLHMRMLAATKEKRAGEIAAAKAREEEAKKAVSSAPKYNATPGSAKPVAAAKDLGPKVKEYLETKERRDKLKAEMDRLEKLPFEERKKTNYTKVENDYLEANGAMIRLERSRDFMELKNIYEAQNFNSKPELVAKRSDLESRSDLLKQPDGRNIVAYRGVTTLEFADQFKGLGSEGATHFAGEGIYGNGSYAASGPPIKKSSLSEGTAQGTARSYAGSNSPGGSKRSERITAFGFRSDANVQDFSRHGNDYDKNFKDFAAWGQQVRKDAEAKYGVPFDDVGKAAAAMGVHAYRVPMDEEDYWVVLNRGAVVAALNPELEIDE
jgi:hypothetical protein